MITEKEKNNTFERLLIFGTRRTNERNRGRSVKEIIRDIEEGKCSGQDNTLRIIRAWIREPYSIPTSFFF